VDDKVRTAQNDTQRETAYIDVNDATTTPPLLFSIPVSTNGELEGIAPAINVVSITQERLHQPNSPASLNTTSVDVQSTYPKPARTEKGTATGSSDSTATLENVPYRSNENRQSETADTIDVHAMGHMENGNKRNESLGYEGEQIGRHTGMDHGSQNEPSREEVRLVTETSEKGEVLIVPPYPTLNEPTDELQGTTLEGTDVFETSHTEPAEYDHLPIQADMPNAVQSEGEWHSVILAPSAKTEAGNMNEHGSEVETGEISEVTNLYQGHIGRRSTLHRSWL